MTGVLLICTPLYIIPNLSRNLDNYRKGEGILANSRIEEREYYRKFKKKIERTLILTLDNGTLRLSTQYGQYWNQLTDKGTIGKKVTYYLGNNITEGSNPVQLEIDGQIIYDPSAEMVWGYVLLIMTMLLSLYTGRKAYLAFKA